VPTRPLVDNMTDLETGGRGPGCVVLSIGAVFFGDGGLGEEFYRVVSSASCLEHGLAWDQDTLRWWESQHPDARRVLAEAKKSRLSLPAALKAFSRYLHAGGANRRTVRLWGCGASFDNAILAHCYKQCDMELPWEFWNDRCYRTLKALADPAIKAERGGTYHNALDDAKTQARHAHAILVASGRMS
jgi:3' exoribonuclease, RNase T-like